VQRLGIVVIGRNEGERLVRCLHSLRETEAALVYVDSGSSDGSVERARGLGASVVELDDSRPYSAARGRNEGFEALAREHPQLAWVQFVDGDCELVPGWLDAGMRQLAANPGVAVACGRRRERHPEASPWNRLADMEWDTPPGDTDACGGDALIRALAFREVGGYDASLIAGEEPELCWRLRGKGWRVVRLDQEMTRHDAALERVSQWWRRRVRGGHAYAEAVWRHRRSPDPARVRRLLSILFWAGLVPGAALLLLPPSQGASALLLAGWAWPFWRAYRDVRPRWERRHAALWATSCVIGKLAELEGAAVFAWSRAVRRRASDLIEYKAPPSPARGRGPSGS
jgi:GT2 family glycosyltransferase